ncbi:MAG TPA: phosphoribosylanthranilate isomerase [Caulobacteraceae bacterium]
MRTRAKICCIASVLEARQAIEAGADAIGFVGAMPSGRTISDARIAQLTALAPPPVATFLLTSEPTAEGISAHIRRTHPTTVQIVSHIDPAESERLAALEPQVRRAQVIHVEGPEALDLIALYAPYVHAFLLDSGRPNAATPEFGGTGRQHDWTVSAAFVRASTLPVFLAGGLSAANAEEAIRRVRPFGLDLCSGVRTDGGLDPDKLEAFMAAVRRADQGLASASSRVSPVARP